MENVIEVAPNQLPLFDLLTAEQEIELARVKALHKRDTDRREKEVLTKVELLDKAGFTSRHYQYSTERVKSIRKFNIANWKDYSKYVEAEVEEFQGTCCLLYSRYDKSTNEIVTAKTHFNLRDGKIECYGLTDNWRKYKPESILIKIEESYEIANSKYDYHNEQQSIVEYTVNKYKKLYPDAEVTAGKGYNNNRSNYTEYDKVTVKFKSGSYVSFIVSHNRDTEYVNEKHDAIVKQMSARDLMNYFNSQQPKQ